MFLAPAEQKALGFLPGNDPAIDGSVGFSSIYPFSYGVNTPPEAGQYYFVGIVEHEISEVLGRVSWLNDIGSYGVMDLFRYSAPGVRDLTATPNGTAYFSVNNGASDLDNWNTHPGGDLGDWAASVGPDALLAFSFPGQINRFTAADLTLMNVLGWDVQTRVIQTDGSTSLTLIGGQYYYLFNLNGWGPDLKQGGLGVAVGEFGSWTPIGAQRTASGYEVVWKNGSADQYTVWNTDSSGNFLSYSGVVSGTDYALESLEPIFNQDFNGDQIIGPTKAVIRTDITTSLTAVSNPNHFFLVDSGSGSGPSLKQGGMDVVAGQFGDWTPIGAVQTAGGYDVAWKNGSADQYTVWNTDSNGNFLSYIGVVSGTDHALESLEPTFGQDLNGDGLIGVGSAAQLLNIGVIAVLPGNGTLSGRNGAGLSGGDNAHTGQLAVLGQYMATSFVAAGNGNAGSLVADPPSSPQLSLTAPHT
jgi:hypothetical protein